MMENNKITLHKGKKVCYNPDYGKKENGIVKSICKDGKHAFVVYSCAGNWHRYEDYTAERTPIKDLDSGWDHETKTMFSEEYLNQK